jgi:hypothetical protein
MKSINEDPGKKQRDADLDNPTKPFANSSKESSHEINRGDAKSKTYKGEDGDEVEGPNYDKKSKNADGDTSENAGIFK